MVNFTIFCVFLRLQTIGNALWHSIVYILKIDYNLINTYNNIDSKNIQNQVLLIWIV